MIMRKTLLLAVCALVSMTVSAQSDSGFGIKAGLNYSKNGDLIASVGDAAENIVQGSDSKVGYHAGIYYKFELAKIYVRPELIYTKTSSNYTVANTDNTYDTSKLDVPVLVGVNLIGPLHIFAGPAFQVTLNNDFEDFNIGDLDKEYTIGLHLGAGVNLGKLGFDVRYERGFSENEISIVGSNITDISGRVDTRPSQLIFAVSLKL